ncbi:MAG: type II toxin-antitoxin system HicA family toxin [Verrucomicrobia bacterium]|nr:type II toxin-antitoxin system HicA family toxin [Verrucomicrobiota bacterium]
MRAVLSFSILLGLVWNTIVVCLMGGKVADAFRPSWLLAGAIDGSRLVKEKGSIRYYHKAGHPHLIRVDFHGAKEVPTGTCHAILKAADIKRN